MDTLRERLYRLLRWSERYTKIDMVYFASGNFWLTGGRVLAIGSGMVLTVAFANLLPPAVFGTYKYVLAAAGVVGAFSLNGVGSSIMRAVAQGKKNSVPGAVRAMTLSAVPASLVAAGIGGYYLINGNTVLGWSFIFIAISNTLGSGIGLSKSILLGTGDFKALTISGLPRTLFPIVAIIATLFVTQNALWILFVYFASNLLASWVLYRWSLRRAGITHDPTHVRETVTFGTHLSILGFFMLISGQIDQLLLWHFTDPTTLAVYALALSPVEEVRNFLDNFITTAFPKLAAKTKEEADKTLPLRLLQLIAVSSSVAICYVLLVPVLFKYLFPKYLASVVVTQVLAITILFQPRGIFDTLLLAHGNLKKRYAVVMASQAVEFALFLVLIPLFGLWGAVAATVLSEAGIAVSLYVVYRAF